MEAHMTSLPTGGSTDTGELITDIAGLSSRAGARLGPTDWQEMTQERVNVFADATDDHNFIHVDPERAADTRFGGTIAHGYLTLSLVAPISQQLLQVSDASIGVNYGLDKVRFVSPVAVGAWFRGSGEIADVKEIDGGVQVKAVFTVEVKDAARPAVVAECLIRYYA
jgi:acyl dehydratase